MRQKILKTTVLPSNHISEFTENKDAKDLLLSETSLKYISENSDKAQLAHLEKALDKFFEQIHRAAESYSKKTGEVKKAEVYMLKAFYRHVTGNNYYGEKIVPALRSEITRVMMDNKKQHVKRQTDFIQQMVQNNRSIRGSVYTSLSDKLAKHQTDPTSIEEPGSLRKSPTFIPWFRRN